jgi:hypothetical protein
MTTLPSEAFKYYFIDKLQQELKATSPHGVSIKPLPPSLKQANEALVPQTFADIRADARDVPLSEVWPQDWHAAVPSECHDEAKKWSSKEDIVQHLALIPTLFKFNSACDRAILEKAAHLGVQRNAGQIQDFLHGR